MYRTIQLVAGGLFLVLLGLSALSRRFPEVGWLRAFRSRLNRLSPEQQARMRRNANLHAGFEMILMGVVLPLGYAAITLMTFNSFSPTANALVFGGSCLLIGLGVTAIVRNRRS